MTDVTSQVDQQFLPGQLDDAGVVSAPPVNANIEAAIREALKLPAPNLATLKTFFESLGPGAGLRTLVILEPGETIIITSLMANIENKTASTAKKVTFRMKSKAGATTLAAVTARLAGSTTANALSLSGPCVFAYTAVAKEAVQVESEMESETETRIIVTFYTTNLTK